MICQIIEAMGPSIKKTLDWHGCDSVCHPMPSATSIVEIDELFASRLGQNLPVIPLEDQLNILCDILRQIKATDRNVTVSFDGDNHIVKMIYGNHKKDTP